MRGPLCAAPCYTTQPTSALLTLCSLWCTHRTILLLSLLLFLRSLCLPSAVVAQYDFVPTVQHHVYYSGSHVTSIAAHTTVNAGELYVTDVVSNRVVHYNASGRVQAVWPISSAPSLYSPSSLAYFDRDEPDYPQLLVADSTTADILSVDARTGSLTNTAIVSPLPTMWETGIVLADDWNNVDEYVFYIIDRYQGYAARWNVQTGEWWWNYSRPATAAGSLFHFSAATLWPIYSHGVVFVVDASTNASNDRVLRIHAYTGAKLEPLALPESISGIQAVSWSPCYRSDPTNYTGCLWLLHGQTDMASGAGRMVSALVVNTSEVVARFDLPVASGRHLASPAMQGQSITPRLPALSSVLHIRLR